MPAGWPCFHCGVSLEWQSLSAVFLRWQSTFVCWRKDVFCKREDISSPFVPCWWTAIAGEELLLWNTCFTFPNNMKSPEELGSSWTCLTIAARLCKAFFRADLVQCYVHANGAQCLSSCSKVIIVLTLAMRFQSGFDYLKVGRVNSSVVCITLLTPPKKTCLESTDWLPMLPGAEGQINAAYSCFWSVPDTVIPHDHIWKDSERPIAGVLQSLRLNMNTEALSLSCSQLGAVGQGREGASDIWLCDSWC